MLLDDETTEDRLWTKFFSLLAQDDPNLTAYIYRTDAHGHAITPFWFKTWTDESLPQVLQVRGGGKFRIIIRRGRNIVFSGTLAFAVR